MEKDAIFDAIVDLFNWIYEVKIRPDQRAEIEQAIKSNWNNADTSDQELVGYLLELYDKIISGVLAKKLSRTQRAQLRPHAQKIFKKEFSRGERNERGRVLGIIHNILEQLRHGCTHVQIKPPQSITPPVYPTQPSSGGPTSVGPYYAGTTPPAYPTGPHGTGSLPPGAPAYQQSEFDAQDIAKIEIDQKKKLQLQQLEHKIKMMDIEAAQKVLDKF